MPQFWQIRRCSTSTIHTARTPTKRRPPIFSQLGHATLLSWWRNCVLVRVASLGEYFMVLRRIATAVAKWVLWPDTDRLWCMSSAVHPPPPSPLENFMVFIFFPSPRAFFGLRAPDLSGRRCTWETSLGGDLTPKVEAVRFSLMLYFIEMLLYVIILLLYVIAKVLYVIITLLYVMPDGGL